MGTGFTIDTPLKVARYGISSVLSLVDDVLIEKMRRLHCRLGGEQYEEIDNRAEDKRARRITAYLDLLDRRVRDQMNRLKNSLFETGSEINRYFELLPESPLKATYHRMLSVRDPQLKRRLQESLRQKITAGRIDVNIMTKVDRAQMKAGANLPSEFSDALAALRGFASSTVRASVILSAGMNKRLYAYMARFDDFFPDDVGDIKKQIIVKVSDFRSAAIQGKLLARLGLWVSEFRIESGLNCGGHAFATQGHLLGPVLEEFRNRRRTLAAQLFATYGAALSKTGHVECDEAPEQRVTVQGGIGTHEEQDLLLRRFEVDGTGWGTPFLLVPDAVNIDTEHLQKLATAKQEDVILSDASPLGIPFWNLKTSASEEARRQRIREDHPGSACPKRYLATDTEFSDQGLCPASRAYQKRKLASTPDDTLSEPQRTALYDSILAKSCICHELSGCVSEIADEQDDTATAVCCGPNIVNFDRSVSLDEMVGHIYGDRSLFDEDQRPHMFLSELALYVDFLRRELDNRRVGLGSAIKSLQQYRDNLLAGIEFYRRLAREKTFGRREGFLAGLSDLAREIEVLVPRENP